METIKEILVDIVGTYEPVEVIANENSTIALDIPYIAGALLLILVLYALIRVFGGVLRD